MTTTTTTPKVAVLLDETQLRVLVRALDDARDYREPDAADHCGFCESESEDTGKRVLCDDHREDEARADEYDTLLDAILAAHGDPRVAEGTFPKPTPPTTPGSLLAAVLGDHMTAGMVGGHFNCGEAENIAHALIDLGEPDAAATFLAGHTMGDDDPEDDADHLVIKSSDDETSAARDYLGTD